MLSEAGLLDGLELFYGAASNNLARVYARLAANGAFQAPYEEMSLSGFVRGPKCEYGRTLPATSPLVAQAPGESLLAQAIVPDPCFWSPDMPSRYEVHVELRRGKAVIETVDRELAIRNFGVRGKNLYLDGRRWVLRGVGVEACEAAGGWLLNADLRNRGAGLPNELVKHLNLDQPIVASELAAWREVGASMVVGEPTDELCREATRLGVILIADVAGTADEILHELRRLSRFGAVAVALIWSSNAARDELRHAAPNLVLGQLVEDAVPTNRADRPPFVKAPWAEVSFVVVDDSARFAAQVRNSPHPVIACRSICHRVPLPEARACCDVLQCELAPYGDYAGYVI